MNHKPGMTVRWILLALSFILVAGILYFSIAASAGQFVKLKAKMAVELGAPIYSYTEQSDQPKEGNLKMSEVKVPSVGSRFGTITCEKIDLKAPLYYGDSDIILEKGAGQYIGSGLPGQGRPVLIGGHDISYFAPLEKIKAGDLVQVSTSYGDFQYRVTQTIVRPSSAVRQADLQNAKTEELILYTCYPFGQQLEEKTKRLFVTCEKIYGPRLEDDIHE